MIIMQNDPMILHDIACDFTCQAHDTAWKDGKKKDMLAFQRICSNKLAHIRLL